jgi:hypothetical protein
LAGYLNGKSGQKGCHAGYIPIVLSGLVGAPEDDILHPVSRYPPAFEQRADDDGREIIGTNLRQRAPGPADRGPHRRGDEGFAHSVGLTLIFLS